MECEAQENKAGYTKKNHLYYNLKHTCVGTG